MLDPGEKTCMVDPFSGQFFEPFFEAHDLEKGGPMWLSKADLILAWGWYVLTPTILSIKSKSTKSTMACRGVGGLRGRPGTDRDAEWLVLRTGEGTVDRHARR
jgi:hypothetical protein